MKVVVGWTQVTEEQEAYVNRLLADIAFKDAKIRRLEGEVRTLTAQVNQLQSEVPHTANH